MVSLDSVGDSLPVDLSRYPKLSTKQAGHFQHFYKLSAAIDGEPNLLFVACNQFLVIISWLAISWGEVDYLRTALDYCYPLG